VYARVNILVSKKSIVILSILKRFRYSRKVRVHGEPLQKNIEFPTQQSHGLIQFKLVKRRGTVFVRKHGQYTS